MAGGSKAKSFHLLKAQTTTGNSLTATLRSENRSWQATGTTSSGSGSATIIIEVSNVDISDAFVTLGTITLTLGTTLTADAFAACVPYAYTRARVSAISGTGATVDVYSGYIGD